MCAVAASTFATNCSMTTPPDTDLPEVALYKAEAVKPQGDQTTAGANTVSVGPSAFDSTNFLGAAQGITDLPITVMGRSVVLPLSDFNIWFQRLGYILQVVTFLLCARIVIRGV